MTRSAAIAFCLMLFLPLAEQGRAAADTNPAARALAEGRADEATQVLRVELAQEPRDATAHQLLCRVFYSIDMDEAAIPECLAAVADAPSSSEDYLWLGRAYGMKASRVNPISAFTLARKVVAAFERSVALDPTNIAALRDLGEYYVAAPAVVGGGLDKAQLLAARMMPVSATKAHRLLAQIAEKKGDFATSGAEFKHAVEAERSSQSLVDLAGFYARRRQADESVATVEVMLRLDRAHDDSLVDAASILADIDRSPQLAEQMLSEYLVSPARSDAAPAAKVHVQLGDLLLKQGDRERAVHEYEAALALAAQYAPAHKALQAVQAKALP